MSIENAIKDIIKQHKNLENNSSKSILKNSQTKNHNIGEGFWLKKFLDDHPPKSRNKDQRKKVAEVIDFFESRQNIENHHVGDFYRNQAMNIDLNSKSQVAENISNLIKIIKEGLKQGLETDTNGDQGKDSRLIEIDEKVFLNTKKEEKKTKLLQAKTAQNKIKKTRSINQIDLIEEVEIKALAISILAETNGNIKIARDLLNPAGLKAIKKMTIQTLKSLKSSLQAILADGEDKISR